MNCSNKSKEFGITYTCLCEATKQITITTFVPHLNNKKQIRVRRLCTHHAKRLRHKLNYQITELHKNKSYIEIDI